MALSSYNLISPGSPSKPIWAIAENYRFEPGFIEVHIHGILLRPVWLCLYSICLLEASPQLNNYWMYRAGS